MPLQLPQLPSNFKIGIDMIFRVSVILILLSLFGTTKYYYHKYEKEHQSNRDHQKVIERITKEKETVRERNLHGQQRAATVSVVIDASLVKKVVGQELKALEKRWNIDADQRMNRLHYKTDISLTTRLSGLKVARLDTVINVITIQGVNSTRKAKVAHYNDGYNRLEILDLGDSSIVTGQIRNRITNLAYSGPYPRFLHVFPAVWKPRPIYSEVYCYNPLSGTDTLRSVVTIRRIKRNQTR